MDITLSHDGYWGFFSSSSVPPSYQETRGISCMLRKPTTQPQPHRPTQDRGAALNILRALTESQRHFKAGPLGLVSLKTPHLGTEVSRHLCSGGLSLSSCPFCFPFLNKVIHSAHVVNPDLQYQKRKKRTLMCKQNIFKNEWPYQKFQLLESKPMDE